MNLLIFPPKTSILSLKYFRIFVQHCCLGLAAAARAAIRGTIVPAVLWIHQVVPDRHIDQARLRIFYALGFRALKVDLLKGTNKD